MFLNTSLKFNLEPENDAIQVRNLQIPEADEMNFFQFANMQQPTGKLGEHVQIKLNSHKSN